MPVSGFSARNHPQRVLVHGARADVDERATPPEIFAVWHRRFEFTVDACALPYNAKLERFWTPDDDGLEQDWSGERVWCNPPFSAIEPWVAKAWREIRDDGQGCRPGGAELVVMLVPANRTELAWWQTHIESRRDRPGQVLRVEFLPGRMRFGLGGNAPLPNTRPPFGVCLLIWGAE